MARARRYTYETTLCVEGENDLDVRVSFAVTWGRGPTPPCYSHGGLPADPDEIDDIQVETINGKKAPWAPHSFGDLEDKHVAGMIADKLMDEHFDEMLQEAAEHDADEREYFADLRAERNDPEHVAIRLAKLAADQ